MNLSREARGEKFNPPYAEPSEDRAAIPTAVTESQLPFINSPQRVTLDTLFLAAHLFELEAKLRGVSIGFFKNRINIPLFPHF